MRLFPTHRRPTDGDGGLPGGDSCREEAERVTESDSLRHKNQSCKTVLPNFTTLCYI